MPGFLDSPNEIRVSLRPRWPALLVSGGLHLLVLATIPFWSATFFELDQILADSVQDAIKTNERNKRLVWYRLPPVPSVQNSDSNSERKTARGEKYSENEIVVERAKSSTSKQLIHRPEAKRELKAEVASPNLVAKAPAPTPAPAPIRPEPRKAPMPAATAMPSPAAPKAIEAPPPLSPAAAALAAAGQAELARLPKPPPRKFQATQSAQAQTAPARDLDFGAIPILNPSESSLPSTGASNIAALPKIVPRKYQPVAGTAPAATGKAVDFGALPAVAAASAGGIASGAGPLELAKLPKIAPRKYQAPAGAGGSGAGKNPATAKTLDAPPEINAAGGTGLGGTARTDVAVIGLNPAPGLPPPDAGLSARFSRGKEIGEPAHVGNSDPNAARIPGVSSKPAGGPVKDLRLATPEQILGKEAIEGYFEIRLDLARQWPRLSVPLSPNNRVLPRRIEPHFRGRSAFAVVIPMEKIDRYTNDWIVWFAAKQAPGEVPVQIANNVKMEPPLPIWKLESRRWLVSGGEQGVEQRVQMLVEIGRDGRVQIKELIGRFGPELNQMVTNDLSRWVFQPARKDGRAIDVDAVLEIPFRIPNTLSLARQ